MEGVQIADVEESIYSRVICPICGEETFDNHWICPVCKWEYDGTEEHRYSSANGSTPRAYREAFLAGKEGENV
jgi:ribosomal protein L37AE/L43A